MPEIGDLVGLKEPAIKLIEAIRSATGIWFEPTRTMRNAKAEADAKIIAVNNKIEINKIQERALSRFIDEEEAKQRNIESILELVIPMLEDNANPEKIDPDWLSMYLDKIKYISSEQMQTMWANILARESNNEGSFSKRTLLFLTTISKNEADLFTNVCNFTVMIDNLYPLIMNENDDIYNKHDISFESLIHLESIGLIKQSGVGSFVTDPINKGITINYYNKNIPIEIDKKRTIPIGRVLFTDMGKELFAISGSGFKQEIYDYLATKIVAEIQNSW